MSKSDSTSSIVSSRSKRSTTTRVDVRAARDGRCVAEMLGDVLHHRCHGALPRGLGLAAVLGGQPDGGEDRPHPGAEVLGAELVAEVLLHVAVDVGRLHVHPVAIDLVGQQLGIGGRPAATQRGDDGAHLVVGDLALPTLSALGVVVELEELARAHGRAACGWWRARRCRSPRRTPRHRRGRSRAPAGAPRTPGPAPAASRRGRCRAPPARAGAGSRRAKLEDAVVLLAVAGGAPLVVVAVLPPTLGIEAGGLDVARSGRSRSTRPPTPAGWPAT